MLGVLELRLGEHVLKGIIAVVKPVDSERVQVVLEPYIRAQLTITVVVGI